MTDQRPTRKPVQMSLFEQQTVSVGWVAKRWHKGRDMVIRLLEQGKLRGYRMTDNGWWNVITSSVYEYEKQLEIKYSLAHDERQKSCQ